MTATDPQVLAAMETLKSAAKAVGPANVTVWADIWAIAAKGLEAALDADVQAYVAGTEIPRLAEADRFLETARTQATVLAHLASLALEEETAGTWGVRVPTVPAIPGGTERSGDGQLHSAFHLLQAAEDILADDHGAPATRAGLVADSTHHLDLVRHYLGLIAAAPATKQ